MRPRAALVGFAAAAALAMAQHGCARRAATPRSPATPLPSAAAEPAAPTPAPAAAPTARPPAPPPSPAPPETVRRARPERVRIGLATDLDVVTLPCCEGAVAAEAGGEPLVIAAPVTVRPAAQADSPTVWRLQAAAIRDERPAAELARRLAERTGERADARFDAKVGLYRVRLGGWVTRAEAEAASRRLRNTGLDGAWVVAEGGGIRSPALEVASGGHVRRFAGRRFVLRAPTGGGLRVEGRRYRGAIEVYLNDRGRLNLINELGIEEYLRGVVPRELGPGQYPELEALKAQAVAARSYTLRNLGGFLDEGYDLCGTPQCQVYGGMTDEHPLSDRAVAETAGQILIADGLPADALYTATCGGHTEDVEVVFPLRTATYLRGVPCIEAGATRLAGGPGDWPQSVLAVAVPEAELAQATPGALERALRAVVARAGIPAPEDHLRALDRREVRRFVGSLLDLVADGRLFAPAVELAAHLAAPPRDWTREDRQFAAWISASGVFADGGRSPDLGLAEGRELLLRVALFLRVVERRAVAFASLRGDELMAREGVVELRQGLADRAPTFRREQGRTVAADLLLSPGDDLELLSVGGRLAAVVHLPTGYAAPAAPGHAKSSWTRFRTDRELADLVRARYPGFALRSFDVVSRGVSGRIGRLRLHGAGGESIDLEGLAIRWTLDLPDTRFTARRASSPEGAPGWQFVGSGWGHGVGMCQTGAFAMARRGDGYREILEHYYSGAALAGATSGAALGGH